MEQRIKLTIAYLGGRFHGWQRQQDHRTVQGELERAFKRMTAGVDVSVFGAGRTDAGVHAAGQVAHLHLPAAIPPERLLTGLNRVLPSDIRVRAVSSTPLGFHARKSALAKLYTYRARWTETGLPWRDQRIAIVKPVTDEAALTASINLLRGRHDVASFTVPEAARGSTVRTLFQVRCRRHRFGFDFDFVGDGFLRYQVRRMVAALLDVGWQRMTLDDLNRLLTRPQPGLPLRTAAARGLTLEHVYYRDAPALRPAADLGNVQ